MAIRRYEGYIITLRLRISSFRKYIHIAEAKVSALECRLSYYESQLKGLKNESKTHQVEKIAS